MEALVPCEIRIGGPLTAPQVVEIVRQRGYPHPWEQSYEKLQPERLLESGLEGISHFYVCNAHAEFGALPEVEEWLASEGIAFDRYSGDGEDESSMFLRQYRPAGGDRPPQDRVFRVSEDRPVLLLSRYLLEKKAADSPGALVTALDRAFGLDVPQLVPISLKGTGGGKP